MVVELDLQVVVVVEHLPLVAHPHQVELPLVLLVVLELHPQSQAHL